MGEGLNVTAKGTKELAGGRRLHGMVAAAYGKSVVLCQLYEKLNSCFFAGSHGKISILLSRRQDQKLKVKESFSRTQSKEQESHGGPR